VTLATLLCTFIAQGGTNLKRTTWTEVGLMLAGAAVCALAIAHPRVRPARAHGAWLVFAFALLAVFTTLSITWSLTPGDSWLESSRTFAYLAALGAGVALGRMAPRQWSALIYAMAIAAVVICSWSLLTKIFPGWLAPDEEFARLRPPFGYWNSVGLAAALGMIPLLWLAARRSGHAAVNVLAWPGLAILIVTLLLSYSRGALVAIGVGIALWLLLVPLRLRAIVMLGVVTAVTLPIVAWAFAQDGLTQDGAPLAVRIDAGQAFGALLLLLVATLAIAGLIIGFIGARYPPGERVAARASRALIAVLVTAPAVALLMLANAPGGIDGQISKAWTKATDPVAETPQNTPARLAATGSVRSRYWREAFKLHADSPWLGNGAGSFGELRLRYRMDRSTSRHAHGYVPQTLADLGWAGLALSVLALIAFLVAAARVLGLHRAGLRLPWDAERVGMATLAVTVVVFGVHSALDWSWFVPGSTVPALLCAGWLVSRPPLRERLTPTAAVVAPRSPVRAAVVAAGLLVLASATAWAALQPVRSVNAEDAAFERLDQGALPQAASIARIAHQRDPLAVEPLFDIATIEQARGNRDAARRALEQAIRLEPATAETWRRLGRLRLAAYQDPKGALRAFEAAFFLDPRSPRSVADIITTSRLVGPGG
jgi:tetratricopeptide (TPR) repeat protein